MRENLSSKVILITGGTGSFGKTMVNHLLAKQVGEIRILSRDEEKQDSMRTDLNSQALKFYIGDIRDRASVDDVMQGVNLVFHAAALKQVPSCEFFPMQAVQTNIIGSQNVLLSAVEHKVSGVVCLSTDKAVYPINAMGMSKAMMEKVAQSVGRNLGEDGRTVISRVRYGNVMCSRGSVIPLFIKQIKSGKPITITNPSMTRFLMPLRDSVKLVEFAFENARQGDLFVKKAPACTVADLAEAVKRLFESDVPTNIIGTRHGEKLYETLANAEELVRSEDMGDYYRVPMDTRDLNYGKYFTEGDLEELHVEDYHSHNTDRLNLDEIQELLLSLPEVQAALAEWKP